MIMDKCSSCEKYRKFIGYNGAEMFIEVEGDILPLDPDVPEQADACLSNLLNGWEPAHEQMIKRMISCGSFDTKGENQDLDSLGGYCRNYLYAVYAVIGEALKRWEENGLDR